MVDIWVNNKSKKIIQIKIVEINFVICKFIQCNIKYNVDLILTHVSEHLVCNSTLYILYYVPIRASEGPPLSRFYQTWNICRVTNVESPSETFQPCTCTVWRTKRLWRISRSGTRLRWRLSRLKTKRIHFSMWLYYM